MDDDNNVKEPKCNYYVDSTLQDSLEWWKKYCTCRIGVSKLF